MHLLVCEHSFPGATALPLAVIGACAPTFDSSACFTPTLSSRTASREGRELLLMRG